MSRELEKLLASAAARPAAPAAAGAGKAAAKAGKGGLYSRLADLYERMEKAYAACAAGAGLSCTGCESNCCTSFFQHHTHVEWAYLWRGLKALPETQRKRFVERARGYVREAKAAMQAGERPSAMCPLNEDGLCGLYAHRLMICRLHGTRNVCTLPDGRLQHFPGCARFTALPCAQQDNADCPALDRTPFYGELAGLELEFLKKAGRPLPRVNITIAEMIMLGVPRIR